MPQDRKKFLLQMGGGVLLAGLPNIVWADNEVITDTSDLQQQATADDEKYWKHIAKKYYPVSADYINLENGYFGVQAKPVLQAFQKNTLLVNTELARYARKEYPAASAAIKQTVAAFLQVPDEEIIITRNATEALNIAIQGYPFKTGDEVLLNQLDYFSMIECFRMLEKRGRLKVNAFDLPLLPRNDEEIVEAYRKAITPNTKVILLTHVSNINGLIVPVAKISAMAKEKGIDTITDSAHALGQVPFRLADLGSDFVGMNLHKWIGNPIGAGVLYVKKERIKEMSSLFGDVNAAETSIDKLSHFGTTTLAVTMTIPDSLGFHQSLGIEKINQRLHYLKSVWLAEFANDPKVEIVTPLNLSCAIASFRIKDKKSAEVADHLFKEYKILTVARTLEKNGCVRVTPSLYNPADDMKKLVTAVKKIVG
ncbi:MAG: aminotransferase class V-fold PLP-dependent enzyme [Chitinophagaceae bacterium]|nr:aminotransferase class V-fold PLP-dependent enzyme [Chitinophagaceae bacterium]